MKIFIAGATGVLGRAVVPRLVAAGHRVTGVARSPEKAELLSVLGATPVTVDLFDEAAVKDAVAGFDAVLHLATHIPPVTTARFKRSWDENDRLRREGTRILVDAALAGGASIFVKESISFSYADGGERWIDETTPVDDPSGFMAATLAAEAETARFAAESGGRGVVLRFGLFYGPDNRYLDELLVAGRNGIAGVLPPVDGYLSSIHTDDAGAAVVAALDAPSGVYNVCDDEPVPRREYAEAFAKAFGLGRLRFMPEPLVRHGGGRGAAHLARSHRVRNAAFKAATGWEPVHRNVADGWRAVAAESPQAPRGRVDGVSRVLLALLAVSALQVGLWAFVSPRGFYDSFPGLGRSWVSVDGPFNEHFVRDFAGFNIGMGVLLGAAGVSLVPVLVRTACAAWLCFAVPHLAYHLANLDVLDGAGDRAANVVTLALTVVVPVVVLLRTRTRAGSGGSG